MIRLLRSSCSYILAAMCLWFLTLNAAPELMAGENDSEVQMSMTLSAEEDLLRQVLEEVRQNRIDQALSNLEVLTRENPKFKLAQLIYADLLMAKARSIQGFGHLSKSSSQELTGLLEEARLRWRHYLTRPPVNAYPANLIQLTPSMRHAILVDLNSARLYVFENRQGTLSLVKDYYISMGKNGASKQTHGDMRTPVGVYFVMERLAANTLPERYGDGAFPLNYPNDLDRRQGKTGYGIWLHGTPFNTYSRPPRSSDGCITLSNKDFNEIAPFIDIGRTPVIITNSAVSWLDTQEWENKRSEVLGLLERWRRDWESRDTDLYISHYSPSFRNGNMDYTAWNKYKRRVNGSKEYIKVALSDIGLFTSVDDENILVTTFEQVYESDNYREISKKRMYWRQEEDGIWRIIYEGPE